MKRLIYILIILFVLCVPTVKADVYDTILSDDIKSNIEESFEFINTDSGVDINAFELIEKLNKGDFEADFSGFWDKLKHLFTDALRDNLKSFLRILVIVLLTSVISKTDLGLKEKTGSRFVSVSVVLVVIMDAFFGISNIAINVIDTITFFINSLLPVLLTLMASGGKIITAGLFNTIMLTASSIATMVIKTIIIPLSIISLALKLTYSATEKENVLLFSKQINSLTKWLIGFLLTAYMGIVSLGSTVAVNLDGTALKTAKFAVGSFVPYVGSMLSDSVELVLNGALVVKNSVGIAGVIGVVGVIAFPCVYLILKVLLFKLIHILSVPLSEKGVAVALEGASDCISVLLGMVLAVAVMYILSITVIISVGGA